MGNVNEHYPRTVEDPAEQEHRDAGDELYASYLSSSQPKEDEEKDLSSNPSEPSPTPHNDNAGLAYTPRAVEIIKQRSSLNHSLGLIRRPRWKVDDRGVKRNGVGDEVQEPQAPTHAALRFGTSYWEMYTPMNPNNPPKTPRRFFLDFRIYDQYKLFNKDIFLSLRRDVQKDIPKHGVKLDDFCCKVVSDHYDLRVLGTHWPADFDSKGMIRSHRVPVGSPATIDVKQGDEDADGNVAGPSDAGTYYAWYRGLHILCGEEGTDLFFKVHGVNEDLQCYGCTWRIGSKCLTQTMTAGTQSSGKERKTEDPRDARQEQQPDEQLSEGFEVVHYDEQVGEQLVGGTEGTHLEQRLREQLLDFSKTARQEDKPSEESFNDSEDAGQEQQPGEQLFDGLESARQEEQPDEESLDDSKDADQEEQSEEESLDDCEDTDQEQQVDEQLESGNFARDSAPADHTPLPVYDPDVYPELFVDEYGVERIRYWTWPGWQWW